MGGEYVTRILDRAATLRGYPQAVRTDQGPEFTCRAFMAWAQARGVRHILIQAGKPTQNESFNGKLRDQCLNEHWFDTRPARPLPAPRRFVWNPTVRMAGRRRARWACGQAAFEPVHMSTGRQPGARD
jgi:transposase InsO family protein